LSLLFGRTNPSSYGSNTNKSILDSVSIERIGEVGLSSLSIPRGLPGAEEK